MSSPCTFFSFVVTRTGSTCSVAPAACSTPAATTNCPTYTGTAVAPTPGACSVAGNTLSVTFTAPAGNCRIVATATVDNQTSTICAPTPALTDQSPATSQLVSLNANGNGTPPRNFGFMYVAINLC
jgi:hypothetical protein